MNEGKEDRKEKEGRLGLDKEDGKSDGLEKDRRRLDTRRREEEEVQLGQEENLYPMAASMQENECEMKGEGEEGKIVMQDASRRLERGKGKGRQTETNEKEEEEREIKGKEGKVKVGGEEEEEEEEEGHLSIPSPRPQTRCHYQSALLSLTWIFPFLKNSFPFSDQT